MPLAELLGDAAWAADVAPLLGLERDGATFRIPGSAPAPAAETQDARAMLDSLDAAGGFPLRVSDARLAARLEQEGLLVRLGGAFAITPEAYAQARDLVVQECERAGSIGLARFRDLVGTGRRDAQLLLERLDADGVTLRRGDVRVLRRSVAARR